MGFLRNLMTGREIGRLEELAESAPAPSVFVRLSHLYQEAGEKDKAVAIIRKGADIFPDSADLSKALENAGRAKIAADIQRINSRLEQYPSAMLYAKLAELYLKEDLLEDAHDTCEAGVKTYPEYGGLWVVMAELCLKKANHREAMRHLEKATALDKYNYNALMMLSDVALELGMPERAREAVESILFFSAGDERAQAKLKELESTPKKAAATTSPPPVPEDKRRTTLIDTSETSLAGEDQHKKSSGVGTSLHVEIKEIRRVEGVQGTILIDSYGLVIASDLPEGMDEELVGALLTNICRTSETHSEALTLGEFEDGIIDASTGRIHVLRVDQMIMGVFATPDTKAGLLQRAIHTFAERVLDENN